MSALRDRIARAIYTSQEFAAAAAFGVPIDAKTVCAEGIADAVIAALGLREERRPGATSTLNDSVWTRPDKRRYITDWEETPTVPLEEA